MSPAAFVAWLHAHPLPVGAQEEARAFHDEVLALGGQITVRGPDLVLRLPREAATAERRTAWARHKPALMADVVLGWAAEERWQQYVTQHTVLGFCTRCADGVQCWPGEGPAAILCLDCARAQLEDEDDPVLQEMIRRINAKHKGRVPPGYMVVQDPATGRYRAVPPEEQAALPFA